MVIVTDTPWTIQERGHEAQDASDDRIDWDVPVAKAALHLVAAYRLLHEVVPVALPPSAASSFLAACDSLCATVVVMDDLTATLWGPEPA
jgi:hypothetical protein